MSSITINNCNGASLPPLLLPRTVYNHGSQQSAGRNGFSGYSYPPSEHNASPTTAAAATHSKSYAKIKVGTNYSYNYTTANSSSSLASLVRIPQQYNGISTPVTSNSSLDNLANLASVAVESLESRNRSLKRSYNEEPLASHVSVRRADRRNSRKYSFRMSPPSAAASGPNSGTNSETTSGATSGVSSRASSRASSRVTSHGTSRSSSSSRSRSKSPLLSDMFVANSPSTSANEDSKEDSLPINITGAKVIASSKCKRQRTGPSCDVCRSKKIKCDAMVVVIWQDASLLSSCNREDSLHRPFSIEDCSSSLLLKMPTEIRSQLSEHKDMSLVRHVDKLISFTSCSSCSKKKDCECNFSKGFTRNDIAVFSSLNKKLGKRNSLGDFTVQDYLDVGYSLD